MPRDDDPIPLHSEPEDEFALTLEQLAAREAQAAAKARAKIVATPRAASSPARRTPVVQQTKSAATSQVLIRCVVFCLIGAIVASLPWIIATGSSRRDFYFLELLIGIGAGVGVRYAQKPATLLQACITALLSVIVIFTLRIPLVTSVLIPSYDHLARLQLDRAEEKATAERDERDIAERDPRVARLIAVDALRVTGVNEETADPIQFERQVGAVMAKADARMRSMTREQYNAMLPRIEQMEVRDQLISRMIDGQLRSMGLNPDFQKIHPEQQQAAKDAVTKQVDAMPAGERKSELRKLNETVVDDIDFRMRHARGDDLRAPPKYDELPVYSRLGVALSAGSSLCVLIAAMIAYRIARG